jgi:hypothetical protein
MQTNVTHDWTAYQRFINAEATIANSNTYNAGIVATSPNGSSGAAYMQFLRDGFYGISLGLDHDNRLRVGGWSLGAVAYDVVIGDGSTYAINITGNAGSATTATTATNANYATDAGTLQGIGRQSPGVPPGASQIPVSDANGYMFFNFINSNTSSGENPAIGDFVVVNTSADGYYRKASVDHVKATLGLPAGGTGGIKWSDPFAFANPGNNAWAHGLGYIPRHVVAALVCHTADPVLKWQPGDKIVLCDQNNVNVVTLGCDASYAYCVLFAGAPNAGIIAAKDGSTNGGASPSYYNLAIGVMP